MLMNPSLLARSPYVHRLTPEAAARRAMTDIRGALLESDRDGIVDGVAKGVTLLQSTSLSTYQAELAVRMLALVERDRAFVCAALREATFDAETPAAYRICKGLLKLIERSLRRAA